VLVDRARNLRVPQMVGKIYCSAEQLAASQQGLCCKEIIRKKLYVASAIHTARSYHVHL
jgi:hypothetical protein